MNFFETVETDAKNIFDYLENELKNLFNGIISGTSYAEQELSHILTDIVPVGEAVVAVLAPQDLQYVEIFAQILGDLKAYGEQMSSTATVLSQAASTGNISVTDATNLANSIKKTVTASQATYNNITSTLSGIAKKAVVVVPKGA